MVTDDVTFRDVSGRDFKQREETDHMTKTASDSKKQIKIKSFHHVRSFNTQNLI